MTCTPPTSRHKPYQFVSAHQNSKVSSPALSLQSDAIETSRLLIVGACGAKTTRRKRLPFSYCQQACEPRVRFTPHFTVPRNRVRGGLFCLLSSAFGGLLSVPGKRVIYGVEGEPHSNQGPYPQKGTGT